MKGGCDVHQWHQGERRWDRVRHGKGMERNKFFYVGDL